MGQTTLLFLPKIEVILTPDALKYFSGKIHILGEVDSTNKYAKRLAERGCEDGTVVVAESQTEGHGRQGRSFYSPAHTGLYFSVIFKKFPHQNGEFNPAIFTMTAAVAICRAVKKVYDVDCGIKWPNDIYCNGKKVAGILCEGVMRQNRLESAIVGIGLNVTTSVFPDELKDVASSIAPNKELHRNHLLAETLNAMLDLSAKDFSTEIMAEYRAASILTGKKVTVLSARGNFYAIAQRVESNGLLVVTDENGVEHKLNSAEVHLRLEN